MESEPFLKAFEGPAASGSELRNEPAFQAIERMMEPASRRARTDEEGNINLSSAVDWSDVVSEAVGLAGTGRDLRLLVIVARAWTNVEGFKGLAAGLDLITQALDAYWDSIHPELRDGDPETASLRRKNAVLQIENDDNGLLGDLEMNVVINPRGIGAVRGEELAIGSLSEFAYMNEAPGGMSAKEEAAFKARHAATVARVKLACRALAEESPDEAQTLVDEIAAADRARQSLEQKFTEKLGLANGLGCRLAALGSFLSRAEATVRAELDAGGDKAVAEDVTMPEATPPPAPVSEAPASGSGVAVKGVPPGGMNSRRDVEKCLDMIIEFYERTEPSSPIPHLARRMRRMVPMDFVQLMEEIAPSGLKEFKSVAGVDDKRKGE